MTNKSALEYLEAEIYDRLFRSASEEQANYFRRRFIEANCSGDGDVNIVWPSFAIWILIDPDYGLANFFEKNNTIKIAEILKSYVKNGVLNKDELNKIAQDLETVQKSLSTQFAAQACISIIRATVGFDEYEPLDCEASIRAARFSLQAHYLNKNPDKWGDFSIDEHVKGQSYQLLKLLKESRNANN